MNPRRLVLCVDGTWNSAYSRKKRDDGTEVLKPSNVLKLARSVVPYDAASERPQIVYYDIGVGSLARFPGLSNRLLGLADNGLGGGWGAGFEGNIEDALAFLAVNHLPGDEVFVFGFSRGAATAQAVTRFLDWTGGLPVKADIYYLPELFREYVVSHGATTCTDAVDGINARRASGSIPRPPLRAFEPVDVQLLGVWDTVMALGGRFRARGERTTTASRSFHVGDRPPACVRHARQALAIDELRYDFRPELWREPAAPNQTLEQRWFAGVHSNVGGGYVDDGLANLAFQWMLGEANACGLVTDKSFTKHYNGYAQDRLYRSESRLYRTLDAVRRRTGRGKRKLVDTPPAGNFTLDPSVIRRIKSDPTAPHPKQPGQLQFPDLRARYEPDNVARFLAAQPSLPEYLTTLDIDPPELPDEFGRRVDKLR